ncbi:CrcB family protein [Dactylosporangium sp. AC04546]|uniref:fluoride efflux transporter FluC n=1 Tax=Dactylosporangium sp. AC04546 TaxID=2862460 RepID=UPI001EDD875C|nr:CrcB family protein [Dactylosporangium sp. AC04546]WVK79875.1 CrcB family protein [Dactylosporangium sp. AC04546]
MTALFVLAGAMVGAPLRYLADRVLKRGILVVNVAGSLVLGAMVGAGAGGPWNALVGTGFCGALTTYSTLSHETLRLLEAERYGRAAAYLAATLLLGIGAAAAGFVLARAAKEAW